MKDNRKRIFAGFLAAVMAVSMLPSTAFAADVSNDEPASAVEISGEYNEEPEAEVIPEQGTEETAQESVNEADSDEETAEPGEAEKAEAREEQDDLQEEPAGDQEDMTDVQEEQKADSLEEEPADLKGEQEEELQEELQVEQEEELQEELQVEQQEEAAEEPVSEDQTEEEDESLKTLEIHGSDYVVTITYNEDAGVPDGSRIKVEEVFENSKTYDYNDYVERAAEAMDTAAESMNYVRLFDISIINEDKEKVILTGPVDVQIRLRDMEEVQDPMQVVHFAGEKEEPEIIDPDVDGNTLAFATEGFSVYAVITGTGAKQELQRLAVTFYEHPLDPQNPSQQQTPWKTMYVKSADLPAEGATLEGSRFSEILYDPGIPNLPSEYSEYGELAGWKEADSEAPVMTIEQIREYVKGRLESGVTDGDQVFYYPVFQNAFRIFYENENGAVIYTDYYSTTESSKQVTIERSYDSASGMDSFSGWAEKGSDLTNPETVIYTSGSTVNLTTNLTLVPVMKPGHWVFYDGNAGEGQNVTYTHPKFYASETATITAPEQNPENRGYIFDGWYTERSGGTPFFDENGTAENNLTEDITLYAQWEPTDTSYTVAIWIQDVNQRYDDTSPIKYVYTTSISKTGTTETVISDQFINNLINNDDDVLEHTVATDLDISSHAYDFDHSVINDGEGNPTTMIRGKGDTVINLYYKRAKFTVKLVTKLNMAWHLTISYRPSNGERVFGQGLISRLFSNYYELEYGILGYSVKNASLWGIPVAYALPRVWTMEQGPTVEFVGLYGQPFSLYGYEWPVPEDSNAYYKQLVYLDAFVGNIFRNNKIDEKMDLPANTQVHFWNENIDGTFDTENPQKARFYYISADGTTTATRASLSDRFEGFDVAYWKWESDVENGANMPDLDTCNNISDAENIDGNLYTSDRRPAADKPENDFCILHIVNMREKHSLVFKYVDLANAVHDFEDSAITDIKYETPLITYAEDKDAYFPSAEKVKAVTPAGYYFDDWYLDKNFSTKANAANMEPMKMGSEDIPIYARFLPYDIHVRVFKNGGVNPDLNENFWVSYGEKISEELFMGRTTRVDHSLIGWYTDKNFSEQWTFSTPVDSENMTYPYDGSNDPLRYGYPADEEPYPTGYDDAAEPYNKTTVGVLTLYAKWRDESGGFIIRYVNQTGKVDNVSDDQHRYSENAEAVVGDATPKSTWDDGQQFAGWKLSSGESSGTVYQPGKKFTVNELLAGTETETAGDGRVVHVITFTAQYKEQDDRTPTHIYWFYNDPVRTGNDIYFSGKDEELGINESVKVPYLNSSNGKVTKIPDRTGYKFLGWAKKEELKENNVPTGLQTVTERDLFIKYDETSQTYDINEVFADEITPYDALYAVWAKEIKFYIQHSSQTGDPEEIEWVENKEFDLTKKVASEEYLYGGYGVYEGEEVKLVTYPNSDSNVRPGTRVIPDNGDRFYLREVSVNYLKPQIFITYYKNYTKPLITSTYGLVNIDNAQYYKQIVLTLKDKDGNPDDKEVLVTFDSIELVKDGMNPEPYGFDQLFGTYFNNHSCVSALINLNMDSEENIGKMTLGAYYVTQDNIRVRGRRLRDVDFGDGCFYSWTPDSDGIKSSTREYDGDDKVTDLNKTDATEEPSTPDTTGNPDTAGNSDTAGNPDMVGNPVVPSSASPRIKTLSRGLIRDKSYIKQYTVTKMIGSESEVQTVAEGSCTGQIIYPEKPDAMFAGWYLDKAFKNPADFSNVTGDMTVYARYINSSDVTFSLARSGGLIGKVAFEAVVSVKGAAKPDDIEVHFVKGSATADAALTTIVKENIGTKKKPVYLYKHKGSVKLDNITISDGFTAQMFWTTPDGTRVEGKTYTVQYERGSVTLE